MRTYLVFLLLFAPTPLLGQTYRDFINNHVKSNMNLNRCGHEMRDRYITGPNGRECKDTDTFINAGTNRIKEVCAGGGQAYGNNLRVSNTPFSTVVCTLRSNRNYPRCEYRGRAATLYIIVACEGGYPALGNSQDENLREEPAEVTRAFVPDASWTPVPCTSHWEETKGNNLGHIGGTQRMSSVPVLHVHQSQHKHMVPTHPKHTI
ncbi:hypothetical protein WMY93_009535 [Mugilogobius chulae]|uniref:Ribonuclease A-domain domain-containing protein n=1 Tax=Mugilogobius chulae TaxID=88201 RepID=A0AAW0PKT5_9GOBI